MHVRIDAVTLRGVLVRLEPLAEEHVPGLAIAAEQDRSAYDFTRVPRAGETAAFVRFLQAREGLTPFAQVRQSDGAPVGCTSYGKPRTRPDNGALFAVEIGWTWLAGSAQRTGINSEAKLLLMTHAFENLGVARLDLLTDSRNQRSRQAIANIGATFEGVLRNWGPSWAPGEEGGLRDSAVFSVTDGEWPQVKSGLTARIRGRAAPAG
jgi:RimJ/RimL family protein N-acetyltransferase